jgi:hypothetical protein
VVAGDSIVEVNGVGGDPSILRNELLSARYATSVALVFERDINVVEQHVLSAITERYAFAMQAAQEGSPDFKAGGKTRSEAALPAAVSSWAMCGEELKPLPHGREAMQDFSGVSLRKLSTSNASTFDNSGSSTEDDGDFEGSNASSDRPGAESTANLELDSSANEVRVITLMDREEEEMDERTDELQLPYLLSRRTSKGSSACSPEPPLTSRVHEACAESEGGNSPASPAPRKSATAPSTPSACAAFPTRPEWDRYGLYRGPGVRSSLGPRPTTTSCFGIRKRAGIRQATSVFTRDSLRSIRRPAVTDNDGTTAR